MDSDDQQVGRILSRRELLTLVGAAGVTVLAAGCLPSQDAKVEGGSPAVPGATGPAVAPGAIPATNAPPAALAPTSAGLTSVPACVVRPAQTEGPFYVDADLVRSDVRTDTATGAVSDGVPLALTFRVGEVTDSGCAPLAGAIIDIWHCDAQGVYSGVSGSGSGNFLRGSQATDADGIARFTTVYPGWYQGRTVHIHFKVHPDPASEFTSQLYFDDAFSDQVYANPPYAARGQSGTRNANDGIFNPELLLTVTPDAAGYASTFDIGIQGA